MIKQFIVTCMTVFFCGQIFADSSLTSATISSATVSAIPQCLQLRVRGFCTWFSPIDGYNTTPYVEHYLPDLVVTVYNKAGDNPWTEMNQTIDKAGAAAQQTIVSQLSGFDASSGQHSFIDNHQQSVFFKESDVVGNPALAVLHLPEITLPSTSTPLMPYYQSLLDSASWRAFPQLPTVMAEEGYAVMADVVRHVGGVIINWGGVLPHEGKVQATNDAKAAAVIAQRASDLTTASVLYAHIRQPLSTRCGQECTAAPIQENSPQTEYQMIYPQIDKTCGYFGQSISYGENAEQQTQGAYAWVVWRFYSGCQDGDGVFVSKTITN